MCQEFIKYSVFGRELLNSFGELIEANGGIEVGQTSQGPFEDDEIGVFDLDRRAQETRRVRVVASRAQRSGHVSAFCAEFGVVVRVVVRVRDVEQSEGGAAGTERERAWLGRLK